MHIKNKHVSDVVFFLLAILIVLDCASVYMNLIGFHYFQSTIDVILVICILMHGHKSYRLNKKSGYILIFLCVVFLLLIICGDFAKPAFIFGCVIPMISFIILFSGKTGCDTALKLLKIICDVVICIALVSLVFYLFGTTLKIIKPQFVLSASRIGWSNYSYSGYFGIYYEGQNVIILNQILKRNIGLFLEAPAFAFVLLCSLFLELFIFFKDWKRSIILIITLISTFTTSGYCFGLILIFLKIYKKYMVKSLWKLLVPVGIIVAYYVIITLVRDKFTISGASGDIRSDDMLASFDCFKDHWFVGIGFNQVEKLLPYRAAFRRTGKAGMSMGIPYVLATGGIIYGSMYLVPFFKAILVLLKRKGDYRVSYLCVSLILMLFVLVFQGTIFAELLLAISWLGLFSNQNILAQRET